MKMTKAAFLFAARVSGTAASPTVNHRWVFKVLDEATGLNVEGSLIKFLHVGGGNGAKANMACSTDSRGACGVSGQVRERQFPPPLLVEKTEIIRRVNLIFASEDASTPVSPRVSRRAGAADPADEPAAELLMRFPSKANQCRSRNASAAIDVIACA